MRLTGMSDASWKPEQGAVEPVAAGMIGIAGARVGAAGVAGARVDVAKRDVGAET